MLLLAKQGSLERRDMKFMSAMRIRMLRLVWNAVLEAGEEFGLMVIAPAHHRRIAAGILSWGQDLDHETSPFQVNLAYQGAS